MKREKIEANEEERRTKQMNKREKNEANEEEREE